MKLQGSEGVGLLGARPGKNKPSLVSIHPVRRLSSKEREGSNIEMTICTVLDRKKEIYKFVIYRGSNFG